MSMATTEPASLRLVYFAWVRERIGLTEETVAPPVGTATIADLVRWLKTRGEGYELAFENETVVRAAVDQTHAKPATAIAGAREVAFFPPMTGG